MTTWDELTDLLIESGDVRSLAAQARLYDAILLTGPQQPPEGESARRLATALANVDRTWLAALGEDPTRSREDIDRAVERCGRLRAAGGLSALPLRYARVELCTFFGERADALEQLRVARLFSFDDADAGATLATARMHDDFSGVIRTTSGVPKRPEADPAGTSRSLAASLLPYLAQQRKVEAEDALMSAEFPERNHDGIARDGDGGISVGTVIERDPDYLAPVCDHFGNNNLPDGVVKACDLIDGCTLCDPEKIVYIDELDPEDSAHKRLERTREYRTRPLGRCWLIITGGFR